MFCLLVVSNFCVFFAHVTVRHGVSRFRNSRSSMSFETTWFNDSRVLAWNVQDFLGTFLGDTSKLRFQKITKNNDKCPVIEMNPSRKAWKAWCNLHAFHLFFWLGSRNVSGEFIFKRKSTGSWKVKTARTACHWDWELYIFSGEDFLVKIHTVCENRWKSSKRLVKLKGGVSKAARNRMNLTTCLSHVASSLEGRAPLQNELDPINNISPISPPKKGDDTPTTLSRAQRVQHHTHAIRMGLGHPILSDFFTSSTGAGSKVGKKMPD